MVRKCLLSFLLICFCSGLFAQANQKYDAPDYTKIEKITHDKASPFNYQKLFTRYQKNDTTLSAQEYQYLYYGYFFQPAYSPMGSFSDYNDSIRAMYKKDVLTINDQTTVVRFTKELLQSEPFDISNLNRLYRLYLDLGAHDSAKLYLFKLEMLAKTLFATGDGKTEKTAIHVLSVNDEYSVLGLLGYEFDGTQQLTDNECDYLKVKHNDDGLDGMYFNVTQIFNGYHKLLSSEKEKKGKKR